MTEEKKKDPFEEALKKLQEYDEGFEARSGDFEQ